jgi:hypothetical protein
MRIWGRFPSTIHVSTKGGCSMSIKTRKCTAGLLAAVVLAVSATPAAAGSFGPGNSDKGVHDAGAKCHPPGQTVDTPGCK